LITPESSSRFGRVDHDGGVPIDLSTLPDDPATLQQMLREAVTAAEQQQAVLRHSSHLAAAHQPRLKRHQNRQLSDQAREGRLRLLQLRGSTDSAMAD
jgi:hypothetical protein